MEKDKMKRIWSGQPPLGKIALLLVVPALATVMYFTLTKEVINNPEEHFFELTFSGVVLFLITMFILSIPKLR